LVAGRSPGPVVAFAARLGALAGLFGLAVMSALQGSAFSERELTALYALVLVGFLLALAWGVLEAWAELRFPRLELAGDLGLIATLVYCTGGVHSWLGFLFVVWIVSAALRAGPRAALFSMGWATAGYLVAAVAPSLGWLPPFQAQDAAPPGEASVAFLVHGLAFVGVALLARHLAGEIQTGRRELSELGEIHRRIVDNVPSGLLSVGAGGRILSYNREAERITGLDAAQAIGQALGAVFPELASRAALEALVAEGHPGTGACDPWERRVSRFELNFERPDGQRRLLGMSASLLRGERGTAAGAIVIFQDLTRIADMEEQLRRSERLGAVGQLAAGLAHEIRNPLASLSGAVELLGADLRAEDDGSRRLAEIVRCETARLNRLVTDFLTYARPGPGQLERVELRSLFRELEELWRSSEHGGVCLCARVESEVAVSANPDQLRQVLWNLVRNAAEAEPVDGEVKVSARPLEGDASWVEISVEDRGSGIAPEQLERVFEPFYTTKPKGTGLGLATVHRIVEAHGGNLALTSVPGQGTSVRFRLRGA
jgi:two-component system sensor histidine kinase PilS (NtrC family)